MNTNNTPLEMFYRWERETPELTYTRQSLGGGQWIERTWREVGQRARKIASYLLEAKLPAQSNIGIWSGNSSDWIEVDLAIMMAGHVSVPLFAGQEIEATRYIINHSGIELLFCGATDFGAGHSIEGFSDLTVIACDGFEGQSVISIADIVSNYSALTESPIPDVDSLMTIVYSSGTTGHPKGAMHSHRTPALVMPKILKSAGIGEYGAADRQRCELISYLPLAHMAERVFVEMISLYANAQVSISRGVETFSEEIREVKPTFFFSVPRLWDRFKMSVEQMVGNADPSTWSTLEKQKILTALGLKRVEFAMNASAPLCIATGEWFKALGISIREGYGMTETFATGTTFSIDQDSVVGSAGYASELAEVAIADDGEILFRAPGLMRGYYNNQQATAQAISDGWYRTGDSGVLDDKGLLWVKGRMGAVFKTSKGKFIHPELIEERFKGLSDIEHGVAFGHARKQPSMIVCLSDTGRNRNSTDLTNSIENYVSAANADIPAYQKVETVFVVRDSWSVSTGLLTPTQKPKRQNILELYLEKIGSIRDPSEVEFI